MELWACELACVRHHRRRLFVIFPLSLTPLFVVTTLSPSSSLSIGWIILPSNHPPSSSTSFHLTYHRFITSQMALDTTRELVFLVFFFRLLPLPPLPLPPVSFRSVPPSLRLSLSVRQSLFISISRSGSWFFQDRQHPHSSSQNITKHTYKSSFFFPGLRSSIGNPIPSSISVCLYLYIDMVHTHFSYNHCLQHRHLYSTSPDPPTANP